MPRRDPPPGEFEEAVKYLEAQGFKIARHRFGPKTRIDLSWPDDRRGIRLPEWRVVEIAGEWRRRSSLDLAQNDVDAADQGDQVGHHQSGS